MRHALPPQWLSKIPGHSGRAAAEPPLDGSETTVPRHQRSGKMWSSPIWSNNPVIRILSRTELRTWAKCRSMRAWRRLLVRSRSISVVPISKSALSAAGAVSAPACCFCRSAALTQTARPGSPASLRDRLVARGGQVHRRIGVGAGHFELHAEVPLKLEWVVRAAVLAAESNRIAGLCVQVQVGVFCRP
jgi:hypothetical protein